MKLLRLLVEGRDKPEYWLHVEASADDGLDALDGFLRSTWLECCGHMSVFEIDGESYSSCEEDAFSDHGMEARLGNVVRVGAKLTHEYDMGTTTRLSLRVLAEREGGTPRKGPRILARNEPPAIPCACGKLAAVVCSSCRWEPDGWLCKACGKEHECGEEMLLPVVNSPRVGQCAYGG
ncbi:MAG: hypothetical protein HY721_21220 [Planctomycetes bacterium]|nr:hypothetical protein [Planctomycetota bacterium]